MEAGTVIVVYPVTWTTRLFVTKKAADRNTVSCRFAQLERREYNGGMPQAVVGRAATAATRDFGNGVREEPVCSAPDHRERVRYGHPLSSAGF